MSSTGQRIVFTGGSGKAGKHVIPYLLSQGHSVLNLDLIDFPDASTNVFTLKTDLTDSGQVFNALTTHFNFAGYDGRDVPGPPDAVIHFAAYARNMLVPDNECFKGNATSTYNVIEAACKLGVKKIVIASSETTYEVCFGQGDLDYSSFPLDEENDVNPMDTYAISKLVGERVARGFARRFDADIYALRIGNVVEPHEYERDFPKLVNPREIPQEAGKMIELVLQSTVVVARRGLAVLDDTPSNMLAPSYISDAKCRKRNAWSYIDARDLGQICDLCVQKDGLGFQVFNATNDTITATFPTRQFLENWCPNTPITRELGEWEAPLSNRKIREVLGFKEKHNWRQYYNPDF